MITVFGEGRGFRVVWLLEEMGLPYRLRPVDLLAGAGQAQEFEAYRRAPWKHATPRGHGLLRRPVNDRCWRPQAGR